MHHVERLLGVVGQFIAFLTQPANQRAEYMPHLRHYMRKLYKIQFIVSLSTEVSYGIEVASLHRILAGQPALYAAISSTCGASFMNNAVQAAGSLSDSIVSANAAPRAAGASAGGLASLLGAVTIAAAAML